MLLQPWLQLDTLVNERYIRHKWTPMEFAVNERGMIVFKDTQAMAMD